MLARNDININLKKYYRQIRNGILCDHNKKKKFLNDLKTNINDFKLTNQNTTFSDIVNHFGAPEDIINNFNVVLDEIYIKKYNKNKIFKASILIFLIIIIIAIVSIATIIVTNNHRNAMYYFDETISSMNSEI